MRIDGGGVLREDGDEVNTYADLEDYIEAGNILIYNNIFGECVMITPTDRDYHITGPVDAHIVNLYDVSLFMKRTGVQAIEDIN